MNYSKIAVRYAKAIFLLAQEKNQLKEVADDMNLLIEVEHNVPALKELYQNPVLSPKQKKQAILEAFKSTNALTQQLIALMIENRREAHLSGVARNYIKRYNDHLGIKDAVLTTAVALSQTQIDAIVNLVKDTYKSEVSIKTQVKEDLIGGFVLKVEDTQYDASIATQLKNIKQSLL